MRIPAFLPATALALAIAVSAPDASSQTLEIDHLAGTGALVTATNRIAFERGDELRIAPGQRTGVRITRTNSALYVCSVEQEEVEVPEMKALRDFLGNAGDLVPALARGGKADQVRGAGLSPEDSIAELELAPLVARMDAAISGPHGFRQAYLETLATLNRMRDTRQPADTLAAELKRKLPCVDDDCQRLEFVDEIAETLPLLFAARHRHSGEAQGPAALAADEILKNAENLVAAAHEAQMLALLVARAKSSIDCDPVQVSRSTGRELKISVTPRKITEIERVAEAGPLNFKVTAMPRLQPHPTVGLALLYAWGARFDKFGTTADPGGARIVTTGTEDERVGYGLVLGLAWNDRLGPRQPRVRFWLPEITINPDDHIKTLGLGTGLSLGVFKLGTGMVWNRHTKLVGQQMGEVLSAADLLKTENTYGRPRGYVSLSFMGWPPFLSK